MTYKARIKAFRESRKLTHQQFADAVGVSRGSVQQWETGATAPKRVNQPAVAKFMGITASELMDEAEPAQSGVIPPENKPNQPLAGASIASGAIDINVNRRAQPSAREIVDALSALVANADPAMASSLAGALADFARAPTNPRIIDQLTALLAPAAFTQQDQRTG